MASKLSLLTNLHQKKQPWNPDYVEAVTSPFGIEKGQLKDAETNLEFRLAVIKAQQDSLIQQTSAAIKTFNATPKVTVEEKDTAFIEVEEDPDIIEKYEILEMRAIQGSDLKCLFNTIPLKVSSASTMINDLALGVLFKKRASSPFLELDELLFPKKSYTDEVIPVKNLLDKILPFHSQQLENLKDLISTSTASLLDHPIPILPEINEINEDILPEISHEPMEEAEVDDVSLVEAENLEEAPRIPDNTPKKSKTASKKKKKKEEFDFNTVVELSAFKELKPPKYRKKERKFTLQFQKQNEKPKNIVEKWLEQKETFSFDRFLGLKDLNGAFFKQFNGSIKKFKESLVQNIPELPDIDSSFQEDEWVAVEDQSDSAKRQKLTPSPLSVNISIESIATKISDKLNQDNLAGIVKEIQEEQEVPQGILFASVIMAINGKELNFPVNQLFD